MNQNSPPDDLSARLQIMAATQAALATQRAATVGETNGRLAAFLLSVSVSLLTLGVVAQAAAGAAFYLLAYGLLGCLVTAGLTTFDRLVQTAIDDYRLARAEARVRGFYLEVAPDLEPWFASPPVIATPPARWRLLLTTGSLVALVAAALAGLAAGLGLTQLFAVPPLAAAVFAVLVGGIGFAALVQRERVLWARVRSLGD